MNKNLSTSNSNEMRLFLKHILKFSLFFIGATFIMIVLNMHLFKKFSFHANKSTKTIITGDSHTNAALWPKHIPNSINISQKAEPLLISYLKVKHVIENNPQLENIIVGLSYHNISHFNDLKFKNDPWADEMFNRVYPILELKELLKNQLSMEKLLYSFSKNILVINDTYLGNYFRSNLDCNKIKYPYTGGYNNSNKKSFQRRPNWLKSRINRHFFYNEKVKVSNQSLEYINKLIMLSNENNKNLIFISTPLHKKYMLLIPDLYKSKYDSIMGSISQNSNVYSFNYSNMFAMNKYFKDYDHVNKRGSIQVSERVKEELIKISEDI